MKQDATRRKDADTRLVLALAILASVLSFSIYLRRGDVLLYGDAVAHINIARKVFDSQTPGILQLGTVWLPLPHLLMLPFLVADGMWTSGIGGSIPSMCAYVLLVVGVYLFVRDALCRYTLISRNVRIAAWLAAVIVALNPNILYLQSTAMTEVLYLTLFVWAAVFFARFVQETLASEVAVSASARSNLLRCAGCIAAAEWTRYDGWFLAVVLSASVLETLYRFRRLKVAKAAAVWFLAIVAAPAVIWLTYNTLVYGNPVEFATGPYSAKAIEQRTTIPGYPPHPGTNDPLMAGRYFFKAAELNMAEGGLEKVWALVTLIGVLVSLGSSRGLRPLLLLLVPALFYALSVAYSGVPVFVPPWWPFSYYNVRYGIQLLPAFAVMTSVVVYVVLEGVGQPRVRAIVVGLVAVLVFASWAKVWSNGPVCYREAWVNSRTRIALEHELAHTLKLLPGQSMLLMYLGDHVGALQSAEVHLRRVIHEGNHRPWKRPTDPDGIWENALASPRTFVDYVVSFDGDEVDRKMSREGLVLKWVVRAEGQPTARVWETLRLPN